MTKFMRSRLVALLALMMIVSVVAGCGGAKTTTAPATATAAQTTPASTPAPAPQVDKAAIVKDAAVAFFNALPPNNNMMDGADLKKKVEAKDAGIYMVDIRSAEDFAKGHIEGAVNIPFGTMGKSIDKLPKDKQIVLMCYSGQTSGQTLGVLKMAGFNAISLKGGFPAWEKAGGAVAK